MNTGVFLYIIKLQNTSPLILYALLLCSLLILPILLLLLLLSNKLRRERKGEKFQVARLISIFKFLCIFFESEQRKREGKEKGRRRRFGRRRRGVEVEVREKATDGAVEVEGGEGREEEARVREFNSDFICSFYHLTNEKDTLTKFLKIWRVQRVIFLILKIRRIFIKISLKSNVALCKYKMNLKLEQ